jgi:hypothetical protein
MMRALATLLTAVFALVGSVALGTAANLTAPKDKPILEIVGNIGATNKDGAAVFDREMLESLGMETITTTTPWHKGTVTFEGVPMAKVMELVGAKGKTVKALALNDYVTQIPMEDFAKFGVILALKRDGEYMPVRDKGPLFIVYPYDSKPELKSQTYYGRSAWQLKRLEIAE